MEKKTKEANSEVKTNLNIIYLKIKEWFVKEAEHTILLVNAHEIEEKETINLYHHDIHKKKITRSAITSLESPNWTLTGHKKCSNYITQNVSELLENKFNFNKGSQTILLNELDPVFSEEDNMAIEKKQQRVSKFP